jgi:hypothetical protein
MFHRAPAIDKIAASIGWSPSNDLDGILDDVIAFTRAGQAPSPT